jgi:hypothetical protein
MGVLASGLPEVVADGEALVRYVTSSRQFTNRLVKGVVFLPNPSNGETSVFRHGSDPRSELWRIGYQYAAGNRHLHGAAIVTARSVREAGLDVVAQEPPPRHANITGWP